MIEATHQPMGMMGSREMRRVMRRLYDSEIPAIDTMKRVAEFHLAFGHPIHREPHMTEDALNHLRLALLREEVDELEEGLNEWDAVKVLDALCDIQYVLDGAFLSLGFANYKSSAFMEVHASNMTKLGEDGKPLIDENGKVMKGPNYRPPNVEIYLPKHHRPVRVEVEDAS